MLYATVNSIKICRSYLGNFSNTLSLYILVVFDVDFFHESLAWRCVQFGRTSVQYFLLPQCKIRREGPYRVTDRCDFKSLGCDIGFRTQFSHCLRLDRTWISVLQNCYSSSEALVPCSVQLVGRQILLQKHWSESLGCAWMWPLSSKPCNFQQTCLQVLGIALQMSLLCGQQLFVFQITDHKSLCMMKVVNLYIVNFTSKVRLICEAEARYQDGHFPAVNASDSWSDMDTSPVASKLVPDSVLDHRNKVVNCTFRLTSLDLRQVVACFCVASCAYLRRAAFVRMADTLLSFSARVISTLCGVK